MKIEIHARPDMGHQVQWATAFLDGLARHGITSRITKPTEYGDADLHVMWSYRHTDLMNAVSGRGGDCLIMERGFLGDREENTALGFNGLNGHATFVYAGDPAERGLAWHHLIRPWPVLDLADHYLICGQVLGDMSLANCPDYPAWLATLPVEHAGLPVRFRPHPVGMAYEVPHAVTRGSLADDLTDCRAMWCWNSNSAVDALLAGVPAATFDQGSVAWNFTAHDLEQTMMPDRKNMVDMLASAQWKMAEIASGEAWEHLRKYYD
jgi:hypothetical protein